jgi:hypothetical protein
VSKEIGHKLVDRLKQRVYGLAIDPIIETGFDKVIDFVVDVAINILSQMKSDAVAKRRSNSIKEPETQDKDQ